MIEIETGHWTGDQSNRHWEADEKPLFVNPKNIEQMQEVILTEGELQTLITTNKGVYCSLLTPKRIMNLIKDYHDGIPDLLAKESCVSDEIPYDLKHRTFDEACKKWEITKAQLLGRSRKGTYVKARRQVAVKLKALGFNYSQIGRALDKDHTSVMHMVSSEYRDRKNTAAREYSYRVRSPSKKVCEQ